MCARERVLNDTHWVAGLGSDWTVAVFAVFIQVLDPFVV